MQSLPVLAGREGAGCLSQAKSMSQTIGPPKDGPRAHAREPQAIRREATETRRGRGRGGVPATKNGPPKDGPQGRTAARRCSIPQGSKRTEDVPAEAGTQTRNAEAGTQIN
jgi:hypothetical protein